MNRTISVRQSIMGSILLLSLVPLTSFADDMKDFACGLVRTQCSTYGEGSRACRAQRAAAVSYDCSSSSDDSSDSDDSGSTTSNARTDDNPSNSSQRGTDTRQGSSNTAPYLSNPGCARYETKENSMWGYITNNCGVPVAVVYCWVPRGQQTCKPYQGSSTIQPGSTGTVSGPMSSERTTVMAYVVCDMSEDRLCYYH
jgi:hypothetical protein